MTNGERKELVEYSQQIEDALIRIEDVPLDKRDRDYYIQRLLLRAVRILVIDKLR